MVDEAAANKSLFAVDTSKKSMAEEIKPTPEKENAQPNAMDALAAKFDAFSARFEKFEEIMATLMGVILVVLITISAIYGILHFILETIR